MNATLSSTAHDLCPGCAEVISPPGAIFCFSCANRLVSLKRASIFMGTGLRLLVIVCIEALFGIFSGFLVLIPISAVSSPGMALKDVASMFGMYLVSIAPILATLYRWSLQSWLQHAQAWALINTASALLPGILMMLAVALGFRLTTLSPAFLSLLAILVEWTIGVASAWIQRRYLVEPLQSRTWWMWASCIGWTMGAIAHLVVSLYLHTGGLSLWLGSALGYLIAGTTAHSVLARFAVLKKYADWLYQTRFF